MKHLKNEKELAKKLLNKIQEYTTTGQTINIMEVCGTHTMAIGKSGLRQLLPENIRLISGPGCPVCVTHQGEIDNYLELAQREQVIIATFGDLMRVPGSSAMGSLQQLKGEGAQVRIVYSTLDALQLAVDYPEKEVVFLGVGFETTTPTVAQSILEAKSRNIENFSVYSMHKLVPPALKALLTDEEVQIDGFLCPGHVTTIIGLEPYKFVVDEYKKPCVVAGFEPLDILQGILMIVKQINANNPEVELQYKRGVVPEGNAVARQIMEQVFQLSSAWWRGLGEIPQSGLAIRPEWAAYDAQVKFKMKSIEQCCTQMEEKNNMCSCGEILKGKMLPNQCKVFKKACTPAKPLGPCMVSTEGACAAYYRYELD